MENDERLTRIENKLDTISGRMGQIDVTLAAQHTSLQEHMRRTSLLEARIEPIEKHKYMVDGVLKFLGVVSLTGGVVMMGIEFLRFLGGR